MKFASSWISIMATVLASAMLVLSASAAEEGGAAGSSGYGPLGQHQSGECIILRLLGVTLPPHCEPPSEAPFENWRQDFASGTEGWASQKDSGHTGWCGNIEQVDEELQDDSSEAIRSLSGTTHALVRHGECNEFYSDIFVDGAGPASAFRPHADHFPEGGFTSALHIYLDPSWPEGSGFGYTDSFQVLDEEWPNFRYLLMPVERNEEGLFVGEHEITEPGWYSFSMVFSDDNESLAVEFVLSRHGWPQYRQSLETTMFTGESVDDFSVSNTSGAYVMFIYISEDLSLAIDEEQLRHPSQ